MMEALGIEQPSIIDAGIGKDSHLEIKEKVDFWRSRMQERLNRSNTHADMWRLVRPPRSGDLSNFANPQVTETLRATEALATFMYRALTSAQPNFQLYSSNPNISEEDLWTREQVLIWQLGKINYRRKLLKSLRSVGLFGTVGVIQPWTSNLPSWEATDFIPKSILQIAFDPLAFDMSMSGWHAIIDFVTQDMLWDLPRLMPGVWDEAGIRECIDRSNDPKNVPPEVMARLSGAGYTSFSSSSKGTSNIYQLVTYYGPLRDDPSHGEWCVSTINDIKTVRGHKMVYKRRPLSFSHMTEFEMEPYGYGVGSVAETLQPSINANRGKMEDTATFALFNQFLANRNANIKTSQLRMKPYGLIEVEGDPDNALKALRPQLEAINFGMLLEKRMTEEFRSSTGAADGLQAMVTDATATEASIAQNEAVRRASVMAEMQAEPLLREQIEKMDENNMTFLDQPFYVGVTGNPMPMRVFPSTFAEDIEVQIKVVTDKDFRPARNKALLEFMQIATSIRNQNPQMAQINLQPIVEEFARSLSMNPKEVWSVIPQTPMIAGPAGGPAVPDAIGRLNDMASRVAELRSNAGDLGADVNNAANMTLEAALG